MATSKILEHSDSMRLNTQLESSGAEFLVLGNLLIEGIAAYKTYHNFKGYDIVAVNADKNSMARIQVKSRYQTEWNGFLIKNFDCDFVVLVALNRGYKKQRKDGDNGIKSPDCYVFPTEYVKGIESSKGWGKIPKSKMIDFEEYKNRWNIIDSFLKSDHTKEPTIGEHELIVTTAKLGTVPKGTVGTVVHIYPNGDAFEVEFIVGGVNVVETVLRTQIEKK